MAEKHKHNHREMIGVIIAVVIVIIVLLLLRHRGVATPIDRILGPSTPNNTDPINIPEQTITPGIPDSNVAYFGGNGDTFYRGEVSQNIDPGGGFGQYVPLFGFVGYSAYANY